MATPAITGVVILTVPAGMDVFPEGARHDDPHADAKRTPEFCDRVTHGRAPSIDGYCGYRDARLVPSAGRTHAAPVHGRRLRPRNDEREDRRLVQLGRCGP